MEKLSREEFIELRQKIIDILNGKRVGGQGPKLVVSALNAWVGENGGDTIYLLKAVPPVDYKKLYGN